MWRRTGRAPAAHAGCPLGEAKDGLHSPWERHICAVRAVEQTGRQALGERAACQSDFLALLLLRACSLSHSFSRSFSSAPSQPLKDCFPDWLPRAGSSSGMCSTALCWCHQSAGGSQTWPRVCAGSAGLGINEESLGLALSALGIGFSPGWRRRILPWPSWPGTGLRKGLWLWFSG